MLIEDLNQNKIDGKLLLFFLLFLLLNVFIL
jgi:hypothetical protein